MLKTQLDTRWFHKRTSENVVWRIRYGSWWMLQWCRDGWFSLGIHIDTRSRTAYLTSQGPQRYGPYIDVHLGWVIISVGRWPVWSGNLECDTSVSRGGKRT